MIDFPRPGCSRSIHMKSANSNNIASCRFIVVDAYNNGTTTKFYEHNDFRYLYDNELEERSQYNIPPTNKISTRLMYYDLKL